MKTITMMIILCLMVSLFAVPKSSGGKCPTCGKMIMQGATHICRAKKQNPGLAATVSTPSSSKLSSSKKSSIGKTPYDKLGEMFGVKLGSKVDDSFVPIKGKLGLYSFKPQSEYAPYEIFYVETTPVTKQVCAIYAETGKKLSAADEQRQWLTFGDQYGFDGIKRNAAYMEFRSEGKIRHFVIFSKNRTEAKKDAPRVISCVMVEDIDMRNVDHAERKGVDAILKEEWEEFVTKYEESHKADSRENK